MKHLAARTIDHFSRRFPTLNALLFSTALYVWLLLRLQLTRAKRALSRRLAGPKKMPPSEEGWMSRLLLLQLRRIENLQERMGEQWPLQQEISKSLAQFAGRLSANARLSLAEEFFRAAARHLPRFSQLRMECVRSVGTLRFMQGKMQDAIPCFAEVAETKRLLRSIAGVPQNIRILGDSWFVALGHVAMIDFLIKKQKLGWEDADTVFFNESDLREAPGQTLLRELKNLGILLVGPDNRRNSFDRIVQVQNDQPKAGEAGSGREGPLWTIADRKGAPASRSALDPPELWKWDYLGETQRAALAEEFWETSFPDGLALPYSHAAAKIQNRWEAENRSSNFIRRPEADEALRVLRRQLGIPEDAWYVCLHVRQSGFHTQWNALWEQARDADIRSYSLAIRAIVERGGYVVRMGDPSMPPLPAEEGAVDYAHSALKAEYADILLLSGARFFLGTNSGLSVVPGIYGVPCVLTNWVPVGLPNWFGKDLMIPKLLRSKGSGFVTLEGMLGTDLGYVQNPQNLPAGLEFTDNTPEELWAVVQQMLCELEGKTDQVRDRELEEAYFALAIQHGSYRGSRIGTAFLREYGQALGFSGMGNTSFSQHG